MKLVQMNQKFFRVLRIVDAPKPMRITGRYITKYVVTRDVTVETVRKLTTTSVNSANHYYENYVDADLMKDDQTFLKSIGIRTTVVLVGTQMSAFDIGESGELFDGDSTVFYISGIDKNNNQVFFTVDNTFIPWTPKLRNAWISRDYPDNTQMADAKVRARLHGITSLFVGRFYGSHLPTNLRKRIIL